MNNMDPSVIGILHSCFIVCLAFTILFFVISIVLFFVFDIKTIFNIKTGRAQAKTVKEMQAANASTGRLRVGGKTQTSKLSNEQKNKKRAPAVVPPPRSPEQQQYNAGSSATEVLNGDANQTEVLGQNGYSPDENGAKTEQTVTTADIAESNNAALVTGVDKAREINFVITKKVVCIHTDETIE